MESSRSEESLGILNIRREEWSRVLPLTLAYGFIMASLYVLKPARNALFLDRLGIAQLPYVFFLVALVGSAVAALFTRFTHSIRLDRLIPGTFLLLMLQLAFFWSILSHEWSWSFYVFYVWVNLYGLMATSLLWLLANAVFNPREAKRLFGLVGTGGVGGAVAGGAFTRWSVESVGTENLLLVCMALLGLCLILLRLVSPAEGATQSAGEAGGGMLDSIKGSDLLRLLGIMAGLTAMVAAVVDVQFNEVVDRTFESRDEKTAFFGQFFAALNVFAFVMQLLLSSRILRLLGIGAGILSLPLSLALGSMAVLFKPGLSSGVLLKAGDGGFRHSIYKASTELLFLPVPLQIKRRTKVFLDAAADSAGTGLGAVLVLILTAFLGVSYGYLGLLSLGLIAAWVGVAFGVRQAYVNAFRTALQRRSLDMEQQTVGISDAATIALLLRTLKSPDEREVLYALELLATAPGLNLTLHLGPLLRHDSEIIRQRVLLMLADSGDASLLPEARELLDDQSFDVQMEAMRYVCLYDQLPSAAQMQRGLQDPDQGVRAAAFSCLALQRGGEATLARRTLEEMLGGSRGDQGKVAAIKVLELVRDEALCQRLFGLLEDRAPAVVVQAIQSAGALRAAPLIPALARKLEERRFRSHAIRALACFEEDAVAALGALLEDETLSMHLKKIIPRVLGFIQRQVSVDRLVGNLRHPQLSIRYEILRALNRLHARGSSLGFPGAQIREVLQLEVQAYYETLNTLRLCHCAPEGKGGDRDPVDLLGYVLWERLDHALERIFQLLALLYPQRDIYNAYRVLTSDRETLRPQALELLDNILNPEDRRQIIPLVDELSLEERLRRGSAMLENTGLSREEALLEILRGEDAWLRACLVYALGRQVPALAAHLQAAQNDAEPLVREAAAVALHPGGGDSQEPLSRMEKVISLHRGEIFSHTTTRELAHIAQSVQQVRFGAGATIFSENSLRNEVYLVVSGRVLLSRKGRELDVAGPGESVGIWALFDDQPHGEQALAQEDTMALRIERRDFFDLMEIHPEVARGILKTMVVRLRRLTGLVAGDLR